MAGISGQGHCRSRFLPRSFHCAHQHCTKQNDAKDNSCDSCDAIISPCTSSLQSSTTTKPCNCINYIPTNPSNPKYQEYDARFKSYVGWPWKYVPKTPEQLSTAGFFYIGSADRVTCFQCGLTLRDWEAEHDPIKEHEKHSTNCNFIKHLVRSCSTETVKATTSSSIEGENKVSSYDSCSTPHPQPSSLANAAEEPRRVKVTQLNSADGSDVQIDKLAISNPKFKRMASLIEENKRLKEEGMCRLCRGQASSILFLPCGHLVTCSDCAETVVECNSCGKTILGTVKTYKA